MSISDRMSEDFASFLEKYGVEQAALIIPLEDRSIEVSLKRMSHEQLRRLSYIILKYVPEEERGTLN